MGAIYYCAMPLIPAALVFEHRSAATLDLGAINQASFQSNAFVSAIFSWRSRLTSCAAAESSSALPFELRNAFRVASAFELRRQPHAHDRKREFLRHQPLA